MAFPLLVAHLELWTQEQVPPDTTSPPQQERSERRSPRGCDLQVACSHTCGGGGQGFPMGEDTGPCRRGRFGEEGWRRWLPTMNEARPFSQELPLWGGGGIAEQGCPSLLQQLWERHCSGP